MVRLIRAASLVILGGMTFLAGEVFGGPIDPNAFMPIASSFPTLAGAYTINTGTAGGLPTITGPGGTFLTGIDYVDSPGHTVAVFDFRSINLAVGQTFTAIGSLPLVLLSQGDATIGGTINGNGVTGLGGPGGGGPASPGPGSGSYIFEGGSGGGFGGSGGASGVYTGVTGLTIPSLAGGQAYGDLSKSLQGGSAGGLGSGAGGGGIEIGVNGALHVLNTGLIEANGASQTVIGGGGSGGGIFLHASSLAVEVGAQVLAEGGNGGSSIVNGGPAGGSGGGGGGGGGGRILLEYHDIGIDFNAFNVKGGLGGSPATGTTNGNAGQLGFIYDAAVPEPSSLAMVAIAAGIGLGWNRYRRGQPSKD